MDRVKNTLNILKMHLKTQVDFMSRHDVMHSVDLATVSKRWFVSNFVPENNYFAEAFICRFF